jgi:ComF family protein
MLNPGTLARALVTWLGDALAPPACAACDAGLNRRSVLCATCADAVVAAGPSGVVAFALYGGPIAVALRRLKYDDRPDLAGPLGHLLRRAARGAGLRADVVVPVPLHPARLAERGYNQAALLAAAAARELDAPLEARALVRTRHTSQQARLDRAGRLQNVAGAFAARRGGAGVRGKRVVLVDDVATTGATLEACRAALLDAGAVSVTALCVARAERAGSADIEPRP